MYLKTDDAEVAYFKHILKNHIYILKTVIEANISAEKNMENML